MGVPLLLVLPRRSRNRGLYASVFFLVAGLELYGTAIGTWRWAATLPGLGIPDGNPPSGVASGYVWFDVMALATAPLLLRSGPARPGRGPAPAAASPRLARRRLRGTAAEARRRRLRRALRGRRGPPPIRSRPRAR